jgi:hypothetical protein
LRGFFLLRSVIGPLAIGAGFNAPNAISAATATVVGYAQFVETIPPSAPGEAPVAPGFFHSWERRFLTVFPWHDDALVDWRQRHTILIEGVTACRTLGQRISVVGDDDTKLRRRGWVAAFRAIAIGRISQRQLLNSAFDVHGSLVLACHTGSAPLVS